MDIRLVDDSIPFDGDTPSAQPLGGVETSVILLARELARRGHEVLVRNKCKRVLRHEGVDWAPIGDGLPELADLYIANRGDRLLCLIPKARRTVFWVHNPARYLLKWRYLSKLWRLKPAIIFLGAYHAGTYPGWAPDGGRLVIPYGIADEFLEAETNPTPPPPRAVFTSNPLRSLDWLLDLWAERIRPHVPDAELHLFSGAATYGGVGAAKAAEMEAVLKQARALADSGVVLRDPLPKAELIEELRTARAMLYRGDVNETFCLAVGEAQAMGVPAVVQDLGCVGERVTDDETGTVAPDDVSFAEAAVRLLTDDDLWRRQHRAALDRRSSLGWPRAARAFEELIPRIGDNDP